MRKIVFVTIVIIFIFYASYTKTKELPQALTQDVKTIEIKGQINSAGVYTVPWNATIEDVIEEAGGVKEDADTDSINLNYNIEHQGVIVIPLKQKEKCISINSATVEELDALPGVGEAIANRILAYRKEKTFHKIEEIKEVKGIGDKMFEKIKEKICL